MIADIARIPPKHVSVSDLKALENLERDLKMVVFGQDDAITALASSIKMARAGMGNADKPIASFLFSVYLFFVADGTGGEGVLRDHAELVDVQVGAVGRRGFQPVENRAIDLLSLGREELGIDAKVHARRDAEHRLRRMHHRRAMHLHELGVAADIDNHDAAGERFHVASLGGGSTRSATPEPTQYVPICAGVTSRGIRQPGGS